VSYWDSSALVKLYAKEADSAVFEQFAAGSQTGLCTSRLAFYEIQTTLRRKEAEGTINPGTAAGTYQRLQKDAVNGRIRVIEFSADVEMQFQNVLRLCFQQTPLVFVRTLDAIHLAAAIATGEAEFVATDKRLRAASLFFGLKLFP